MGLLNVALVVAVLLTTTGAKPIRHRHDADIPDKHQPQRYLAELSEVSEESSEESSEEEDEDEEEEEEEGIVDVTEAVTVPPLLVMTTDSMTSITSGDGSTLTPEPDTANTIGPVIMVLDKTPEPAVTVNTADVTTADVIQTSVRATEMRGDM
ncbi:uncharacterized protein V3H82_025990 isoform 1-T2 [Fundulus diaphanus]